MDFDATCQRLIVYSAFVSHLRKKWEYNEAVHQLLVHLNEAYDSDGIEVAHNIPIELGIQMKLVRLIKMCRSETYSRDRVDEYCPKCLLLGMV